MIVDLWEELGVGGLAAYAILCFWISQWLMHLLAHGHARRKLHRKCLNLSEGDVPLPGVSILKPLSGDDPNLRANLESFFTQCYPQFELLFCAEDPADPALVVARDLIAQYPGVNAQIFIGGQPLGVNPKINNMAPGYAAAAYELILISDCRIRMKDDTLRDMVTHMTERTALVHQLPFAADRPGFPAVLEKIYFGTFHSRMYLTADLLGINCHTGMSSLLRRSVIDELGGLRAFSMYIAEDFFIAKAICAKGWKMSISSQPALQNAGISRIDLFQERLARWSKLRLAMVPLTFIVEPLTDAFILGLVASISAQFLFDADPFIFFLLHLLAWFLLDFMLLNIVQNGSLPFSKLEFSLGWVISEMTWPAMSVRGLCDPPVRWRTRKFRLRWGGIAEEIKPKIKM